MKSDKSLNSCHNLFVDAPLADGVKIVKSLITIFAGCIPTGAPDQIIVHELDTELFGTDVHKAIEDLDHCAILFLTFPQRLIRPFASGYVTHYDFAYGLSALPVLRRYRL